MKTSRMASLALLAGWSGLSMAGSHYVVPPGTPGVAPTPPYASWETAGTDLNAVVAAALAGSAPRTVLVTNGVYLLTNQVVVSGALTLASVNGAGVTVVDGNNHAGKPVTNRCFLLDAEGAVLRGFTIRNGYAVGADGGGGVCGKGSTSMLIEACRIVNCIATNGGDFTQMAEGCAWDPSRSCGDARSSATPISAPTGAAPTMPAGPSRSA